MRALRALAAAAAAVPALVATLVVVLLGTPFWVVTGLTRGVRGAVKWLQGPETPWDELVEFEPEIGWKNRGRTRARVRANVAFDFTTDEEGWRGAGTIEESDMVVFGDSFAFGHGVSDRHHFALRVSGPRVKAIGADGYNMVQGLLWMNRMQERLTGKLVVWFVFYGNDLMDSLRPNMGHYRTPFLRSTDDETGWEILTDHVSPEPFPFVPRYGLGNIIAETCTPGYHSDRAFSACGFLLDRALELCGEVDARLAVVGIPDVETLDPRRFSYLRGRSSDPAGFDPRFPDQQMADLCSARDIPFETLSEVLTVHDHLPGDCHWTPGGHAKVARVLQTLYATAPKPSVPQATERESMAEPAPRAAS